MFHMLSLWQVIYLYVVFFILGLILGSGFNCLAGRIASGKKWSGNARSACPACGHTLAAKDLVPLFSWLFLKGKCRYCGAKISVRYPLTELLLGICFVSLLAVYGLSIHTISLMILCCCLFCLSLVDLDTQIIPDRFLIIPAAVRILELILEGGFHALLVPVVTGIGLGGSILILSLIMDKILKKDTMGGGDLKLLTLLGLYFTVPECFMLLIISCILGILIAAVLLKVNSETPFPLGPALSLGAWIVLLAGKPFLHWYFNLFL